MWKTRKNNLICGYLEAYENQKKHIERVLSAKEITKSTISPYYPKFLKLKLCKHHMEEEKNELIKEENKILLYKIMKAEEKPSQYSRIYEPKKCPAFDKELIYFKRIKKEIKNQQENIRFYHRIENIHSYYSNEEFQKRKKFLDENCKLLQKSIFEINPSLLFLSPSRIKKEIEKHKILNMKRSNSVIAIKNQKSILNSDLNKNKNLTKMNDNKSSEKNEIIHNEGFLGLIREDDEEKIKGNDNNEKNENKTRKNSKKDDNKNNSIKNLNNSKRKNSNNTSEKSNKINMKQSFYKKRPKSALKK